MTERERTTVTAHKKGSTRKSLGEQNCSRRLPATVRITWPRSKPPQQHPWLVEVVAAPVRMLFSCEGGPVLAHSLDVSSIQEHGANHCKLDSSARRSRRYLTGKEIERLMDCARKHGRYGHRDATMILVATSTDCGPRKARSGAIAGRTPPRPAIRAGSD